MPNNVNTGTQVNPLKDTESHNKAIKKLILGKTNTAFSFQPTAGTTTSTVNHVSIGGGSTIVLFPSTFEAAAVAEKFCEDTTQRTNKQATFKHPNFSNITNIKFLGLVVGS